MKLGYTIIYVADVVATVAFYEKAFGLARRFVHESNLYAEMETGSTTLGFAGEAMAEMNGVSIRPNRPGDCRSRNSRLHWSLTIRQQHTRKQSRPVPSR